MFDSEVFAEALFGTTIAAFDKADVVPATLRNHPLLEMNAFSDVVYALAKRHKGMEMTINMARNPFMVLCYEFSRAFSMAAWQKGILVGSVKQQFFRSEEDVNHG